MAMDDERLMAYADGALSVAEAAEVELAIAGDATLAAKVAMFADSRAMAKRAFGAAPPVPGALAARVAAMAAATRAAPLPRGDVIDLAARRRSVPVWQLPIAASIALAVGLFGGWIAKPDADATGGLAVAGLQDAAVVAALDTVASGARTDLGGGAAFVAIATFRDGDGQLCREFEHDRSGGGDRGCGGVPRGCRLDRPLCRGGSRDRRRGLCAGLLAGNAGCLAVGHRGGCAPVGR
jgi:hypothetical protein